MTGKKQTTMVYHSGNFDRPLCLPEAVGVNIGVMLSYYEIHFEKFDSHLRCQKLSKMMKGKKRAR